MQFDASNLVNILIALLGSGSVFAVLAKIWLKKHGLNNGTITEMKFSVQRTEGKLDKLTEAVGELKVSMATANGEMIKTASSAVKEHEDRYNHRGLG